MKVFFTKALVIISALLLMACGGGGSNTIFSDAEKVFLKNLFLTEYLWYDQVDETLDPLQFSTPQSMINTFRVNPPDKWSFTITKQAYTDYSNQKTSGFGFGYQSDFRVFLVLIDSPAYGKIQRGDIILKVNHDPATTAAINSASQTFDTVTTFTLRRNGQEITTSVIPSEYTHKVALEKTIQYASKTVGYLRYDAFTSSSVSEIENAFTIFHHHAIDELIIDLRYNGGGSVETAGEILNNITNAYPGQRQLYLDWNNDYKYYNDSYLFETSSEQDGNELDMQRVYFLVTKHSASASELLINALKPYLGDANVITIGDNTHGKPVGMSGKAYGNNYYFLINFIVRNDNRETTSFDGITPTCQAIDDTTHQMGDPDEAMLATALYHIEHGNCPVEAEKRTKVIGSSTDTIRSMPLKLQGMWTIPSPAHD